MYVIYKGGTFTAAFVAFIPAAALRTGDSPVCHIPLHRNVTPLSCSPGSASSPGTEGRSTLKVRQASSEECALSW